MAGRHNFKIDQGTVWRKWVVLWQDRAKTTLVPLTGFTAALHIRRQPETEEPAIILNTENGGIEIDADEGKIAWVVQDEITDTMTGEYFYELRIISPLGEPTAILKGKVEISPEVVKP